MNPGTLGIVLGLGRIVPQIRSKGDLSYANYKFMLTKPTKLDIKLFTKS